MATRVPKAYSAEFEAMLAGKPAPKRKGKGPRKGESTAAYVARAGSETAVSKSFDDEFKRRGIFMFRCNAGGTRIPNGRGGEQFVRMAPPGTADRVGHLPDGRFLGCEVKAPGGLPTRLQIDWMIARNRSGAVAFWADDLRILRSILDHVQVGGSVDVSDYGAVTLV